MLPPVPVILNVYVPATAVDVTVICKLEVAVPPAGGVTDKGLKEYVTPVGVDPDHAPDRLTGELKLPEDFTLIVEVCCVEGLDGISNERLDGFAEIVNSLVGSPPPVPSSPPEVVPVSE